MTELHMIVHKDGSVSFSGVDIGPGAHLHDVDAHKHVLIVKVPAHQRWGGRGMSRIPEVGKLIAYQITAWHSGPSASRRGDILAEYGVIEIARTDIRQQGDPTKRLPSLSR